MWIYLKAVRMKRAENTITSGVSSLKKKSYAHGSRTRRMETFKSDPNVAMIYFHCQA